MKNRKSILLVVLLLAVGFAAVSTTLYINSSTNINPNQDDFNVYYSDAYVNGVQDLSVVTDDTHIVFETELSTLGEKYVLDYEVANGSKNYDAELSMTCTSSNDYLNIVNEFDDETILEARSTRNGTLTLELAKSYAGEDLSVSIECTISANAIERTSLNESEMETAAEYIIEGYYKDSNNAVLANKNLVFFSETPHYVTTDENGYIFYNGLERGKHEVYYVDDTLDNIKAMTKEEIISNAKTSAIFTTTSDEIVFDDNTTIVDLNIEGNIKYCSSLMNEEWIFSYTGSEQSFLTRCAGNYIIELWGAQGGSINGYDGGKGSYTIGTINMNHNKELIVVVGQMGHIPTSSNNSIGGFNGGGGTIGSPSGNLYYNIGATGGGATDIRLKKGIYSTYSRTNTLISDFESLKSRIMVAAGGGGSAYGDIDQWKATGIGGYGGTLIGGEGNSTYFPKGYSYGGTQIAGGNGYIASAGHAASSYVNGGFGVGGGQGWAPWGGGGAGYYGGGSGGGWTGGGAGGSSFISGHNGCDAIEETSTSTNIIHTGQPIHYSGLVFTNTKMIAGNLSMPNHAGTSTMTGNTGNGYAKITYLGTN